jgi:streptogramin lyase
MSANPSTHSSETRRRRASRSKKLAALAALTVTLACVPLARGDSGPPPGARLIATLSVASPIDVAVGFDAVWVTGGPTRTVSRIDPLTNTVSTVIQTPLSATFVAVGAGAVWVSSFPGNAVMKIDPDTDAITAIIPSGGLAPQGIAVFDGYVWVANHHGNPTGSIAKIDPATNQVVDVIPVGAAQFTGGPGDLAGGAGSLWTGVPNLGAVVRLDPSTDEVLATIPVSGACGDLEATDTAVWIAGGRGPGGCSPGITKLDPATDAVVGDKINAGGNVNGLGFGFGSLWYGAPISDFLGRVDPDTDAVVGQLKLPGPANSGDVPTGFGSVWAGDSQDQLLFRVEPQ